MLAWCIIRLPCVKGAPPKAVRDCLLFETGDTKRKSVLTVWVALLQRFCKAQTDTPLFFAPFVSKKSSQKKRRWGHFARPASDKACAALTRAHWRGGSYGSPCERTSKLHQPTLIGATFSEIVDVFEAQSLQMLLGCVEIRRHLRDYMGV